MKLSLVVLGALLLSVSMRRQSAAVRHWILAAAVIGSAGLPLLEAALPALRLPVGMPAVFEPYDAAPAPALEGTTHGIGPSTSRPARTAAYVVARPSEWARSAVLIWLAGAVAGIGLLAAGLLRLSWIAARAKPIATGPWHEIARGMSRSSGLRRRIRLYESTHPSMLITWGVIRPKVIVPAAALEWNESRIRVVVAHELAHVRRGDWILQVGASLLRAVYWFNPLVWVLCRRLRLESEMACDDEVMNHGVKGSEYADHLVSVARELNGRRQMWLVAPAMAQPSSLERRVQAMLNDRANRGPLPRLSRAAILVLLLVGVAAIAAAQGQFVSFRGAVADESGRGVPGVVLTLVDESRRAKYRGTVRGYRPVRVRGPAFGAVSVQRCGSRLSSLERAARRRRA